MLYSSHIWIKLPKPEIRDFKSTNLKEAQIFHDDDDDDDDYDNDGKSLERLSLDVP